MPRYKATPFLLDCLMGKPETYTPPIVLFRLLTATLRYSLCGKSRPASCVINYCDNYACSHVYLLPGRPYHSYVDP